MLRLLGVILSDVCTTVWYRSSLTWGLMRVHRYEYLHLSARIRKCVSLDLSAVYPVQTPLPHYWMNFPPSLMFMCTCAFLIVRSLDTCAFQAGILTFVCLYLHFKDSCHWVTADNNRHGDDLWHIQRSCRIQWRYTFLVLFFSIDLYSEAQIWSVVNICIECVHTVHLVLDVRLHPLYHCINHEHSMQAASQPHLNTNETILYCRTDKLNSQCVLLHLPISSVFYCYRPPACSVDA